jgi:hypothetical protein
MQKWNRRDVAAGLGCAGATALWLPSSAEALGLPADKVKAVHYYSTPGDAQGRQSQPLADGSFTNWWDENAPHYFP